MSLEVFCGPYHPELEEAFLSRLKATPPGLDRRLALVAPSRRMADRLQALLNERRDLPARHSRVAKRAGSWPHGANLRDSLGFAT